ncbi:MAG: hypothetical protein BWY17_04173 [Deltaproteobacteria bacterium ADurb.Bin207]|nr:MAG: hypothetical protein BWY17_04173 [Deltaproteobacteria bacterium ADurb.Bin207]
MRLDGNMKVVVMVAIGIGSQKLPPHTARSQTTSELVQRAPGRTWLREPALIILEERQPLAGSHYLVNIDRKPPSMQAHPPYLAHPVGIGAGIDYFRDSQSQKISSDPRQRHRETTITKKRAVLITAIRNASDRPIDEHRRLHSLFFRPHPK